VIRGPSSVCFYCADQNPHRDRSLGITNYTLGLLKELKQGGGIELHAVTSRSSPGLPEGISTTRLPFRTDNVAGRLLADHFHPLFARQMEANVWHYPKGFLPMGLQVRQPKVGTIADTILQFYADHYPQYRARFAYDYWIAMLKNAVRRFDCIITVSEFSKRSILEFADRYHIEASPVYVTYQGSTRFAETAADRSSREYVLHFASKAPHKKTNWFLKQWSQLQKNGVSLPKLRLIGDVDVAATKLVAGLNNATVTNWIPSEDIGRVLNASLALVFPSELEGFGLPALEAYFCDTPVVYAKGTAIEEILGPGTVGGFNFDYESFVSALNEVLALDVVQIHQKRAELEQRFSWHECVTRTLESYRRVAP
jgi:glycosyltransferase involved in cell wall biosynthesis